MFGSEDIIVNEHLDSPNIDRNFFLFSGNNILYVGVYGPKSPCEEVFIKHMGRNNYQVNYVVRERGDYIVIVKWGDDHIPGSPFKVDVWSMAFDTRIG